MTSIFSFIFFQLTDFGLSRVGLINNTHDFSDRAVTRSLLSNEGTEELNSREKRQKQSAIGTPDYLAPEILLGTGHGITFYLSF